MSNWFFWRYVTKHQREFAGNSDPHLLVITSQVWFIISIGWLVSIVAGFLNVYAAYAAWIVWPHLVGIWGSYKRNQLQVAEGKENSQHVKTKSKRQKVAG